VMVTHGIWPHSLTALARETHQSHTKIDKHAEECAPPPLRRNGDMWGMTAISCMRHMSTQKDRLILTDASDDKWAEVTGKLTVEWLA